MGECKNMENNNQTIQEQDKNYSSIWETNPKLKMLLVALIFVFLGSGIGLAILVQVGQHYREKIYLETQSSIPKHKEPVEKYFTDQSNGYEIKYPSAWVLRQNPDESLELYPKDLYNANYPNDYVLRIEPQLSTSSVFEQGEKGGCGLLTNTFIAGIPAVMCEERGQNLLSYYYRITNVSQTSWGKFNMVSFSLPTENLKLKPEYEKVISQIKITNSQATWKTYKNEEGGFEFKYPLSWEQDFGETSLGLMLNNNLNPENISIWIGATSDRFRQDNLKTLAEWMAQMPGAKCTSQKLINGKTWCMTQEKFEGVRSDSYGVTLNNLDYIIKFNVAYGRQSMDYYIPDTELYQEIAVLERILNSFKFTK
jgi:hypothetical protein